MAKATFRMDEFNDYIKKVASKEILRKIAVETKKIIEVSTKKKIATGDVRPKSKLSPLAAATRRKSSSVLLSDTGALRNSIKGVIEGLNVVVGSALPYAGIHQEGGTITRESGDGKLYIPASKKVKVDFGADKLGTRKVLDNLKAAGWQIWHTDNAVMGISSENKKKIKGKKEKRIELTKKYQEVLFIKKESVDIPKREYLYLSEKDQSDILKVTKAIIEQAGAK